MGLSFRKSKNLGLGLRLNASKSGLGLSWGFKGFRTGIGANGKRRTTLSIPGTGIRYSTTHNNHQNVKKGSFGKVLLFLLFLPIALPLGTLYWIYKKLIVKS